MAQNMAQHITQCKHATISGGRYISQLKVQLLFFPFPVFTNSSKVASKWPLVCTPLKPLKPPCTGPLRQEVPFQRLSQLIFSPTSVMITESKDGGTVRIWERINNLIEFLTLNWSAVAAAVWQFNDAHSVWRLKPASTQTSYFSNHLHQQNSC